MKTLICFFVLLLLSAELAALRPGGCRFELNRRAGKRSFSGFRTYRADPTPKPKPSNRRCSFGIFCF